VYPEMGLVYVSTVLLGITTSSLSDALSSTRKKGQELKSTLLQEVSCSHQIAPFWCRSSVLTVLVQFYMQFNC